MTSIYWLVAPPCEGFSTLRTLNGHQEVNDPRNELLFEFLKYVRHFQPKAILLENVPALARDFRLRLFLSELSQMGYQTQHRVLNTADYGVPQRRRRLVVTAGRGDTIPFGRKGPRKRTVREAIGDLPQPGHSRDPLHNLTENRSERIKALIKLIPKDGGSRTDLDDSLQLPCHRRSDGFKDVYGRMRWEDVAPTITGGCVNPSKGRFLHPDQDRAITIREAAILQGFPRRYKFSLSRGKFSAAQLVGNAIPPEFVRRHALQIRRHLDRAILPKR